MYNALYIHKLNRLIHFIFSQPIKMTELFRSAFNYLGGGGSGGGERGSEFVGHIVELGERMKLKIKKVIAEGKDPFSYVRLVLKLVFQVGMGLCLWLRM